MTLVNQALHDIRGMVRDQRLSGCAGAADLADAFENTCSRVGDGGEKSARHELHLLARYAGNIVPNAGAGGWLRSHLALWDLEVGEVALCPTDQSWDFSVRS